MHFALAVFIIFAVWKRGDWRHWQRYHPTMLYIALGNVMYNFLCANYLLWKLDPDFFPNHSITEVIYTLIIFPGTVLLFLSRYPLETRKKWIYYLKWIAIYIGVEFVFYVTGRIYYQFHWNMAWSLLFDSIMFPMLRLHSRKPLLAYLLSLIIASTMVLRFHVPVNVPIAKRPGQVAPLKGAARDH